MSNRTQSTIAEARKVIHGNQHIPQKDVYKILGFSRPDNFARFLKNQKYSYGVWYNEISEFPKGITLRLFFDLAKKRLVWDEEWEAFFMATWQRVYEKEIIRFTKANHKSEYRHDCYWGKVRGKFYDYSLTTKNIANTNDLCLFEVFRHCVDNHLQYTDGKIWKIDYQHPLPYITWDSLSHTKRYGIIIYLKRMIEEFPVDDLRKIRLQIYKGVLQKLLEIQYELDYKKAGREKRIERRLFGKTIDANGLNYIKSLYRKAVFLCHPDVTGGDDNLFKKVTLAYQENDIRSLKRYLKNLTN